MPPRPPLPKQQQLQKQQHSAANAKGAHARVSASKLKKRATAVAPRPAVLPPMTTTKTTSSPPSPPPPSSTSSKALPRLLPAPLAARLEGAHKPAGLVLASSLLMQASVDVYETGIFTAGAAEAAVSSSSTSTAAAAAAAAAVFFSSSSAHPLITGTAALAGAALGLLYACILYPLAERTAWALPSRPLSVVVTGGSRGLGKALAREHLLAGDSVVVAARDFGRLLSAAKELAEETGADMVLAGGEEEGGGREEKEKEEGEEEKEESSSPFPSPPRPPIRRPTITPVACDVSNADSVNRLVSASLEVLEGARIDCFYNNAGDSGSFRSFADSDPETLSRVVSTNLLGSVLCTRAVVEAMTREREGSSLGHIFLVEGADSDGLATPGHAAYGATMAATAQLVKSLAAEAAAAASKSSAPPPSPSSSSSSSARVAFHALSPGLVLNPLLLDGVVVSKGPGGLGPPPLAARLRAFAFDALCEHPETAAAFLAPRARSLVATGDVSSAVRYLTPLRAVARLLSAPFRRGRHFDAETAAPRWEPRDRERIFGEKGARKSRRERGRAAARGKSLALSFATSAAALFVVLVTSGGNGGV